MGAGRGSRHHAARLGLRLYSGPADRARVVGAAVGCGQRDGVAGGELEIIFALKISLTVVPAKAGTHTLCCRDLALGLDGFVTTNAGGYGSLLSQGRRMMVSCRDHEKEITLPSSALSTSARDVPASLSSDGEGRRCCLLRAPAPVLFPAQWSPRFRCAAARTA